MKVLAVGLLACAGLAFAADKGPVSYHDGTLVSFHMAASGDKCTEGSGQKDCNDEYRGQYTVKSEGILYVLTPVSTAKGSVAQRATLGWSKAFSKNSSLYHHLPGAPLQLRDDGKHVFVKVGDRESMYTAIEAEPEGEKGAKGKQRTAEEPQGEQGAKGKTVDAGAPPAGELPPIH
jgi:hypothetical protein